MSSSTLIEVFGHIVYSFTRGVTEHYNPEEPEFTADSFGYDPLESTGREWYYHPVDEFIFQEYSDRRDTTLSYLPSSSLNVRCTDACAPEENEETLGGQQDEDQSMAWKRLRPSTLFTVGKAMYIRALISLLTSTGIGSLFMSVIYLSYKTELNCQFHSKESIPVQVQWIISISGILSCAFLYMWFFVSMVLLFRPFQLIGVKKKLVLATFLLYGLDTLFRVVLQALQINQSKAFTKQKIPLHLLFLMNICVQVYLLMKHFLSGRSRRQRATFFFQMILPTCFSDILGFVATFSVYPAYVKQNKEGKLLIAIFAPLVGVVLKVISRISVQRLWKFTHPGYSYVLLTPVYFGSAVMFRILQADLDSLQSMATLGIIHGVAEVLERSIMVIIDHFCHLLWKRKSAPWGSFRTPRRERLMADIAIMSMLYESIGLVSVNGVFFLYQLIYVENESFANLFKSFAIQTSILLVIEWFFTSVSLAIETHYQNMAVMAVWRKRWKRHILVAIVNAVPLALWSSGYIIEILHGRFSETKHPCKMPFS